MIKEIFASPSGRRAVSLLLLSILLLTPLVRAAPVQEDPPRIAAFRSWTQRYTASTDAGGQAQLLAEGVALARQRRAEFEQLIKTNPEKALALSIPASVRQQLPAEMVKEMETPVAGIGDLSVLGALPAIGGPMVEPIQRVVSLRGRTYRAYVYGRRAGQTTKIGIPLHGIALGNTLALHESALRELEQGEFPDARKPIISLETAAGKFSSVLPPTLAELGDKIYRFTSPEQLQRAEMLLEIVEAGIDSNPTASAEVLLETADSIRPQSDGFNPPAAQSVFSEGGKNILVIRVDFSDLPGDPSGLTASYVQNFMDSQISPYYLRSSYGITSLTNTVTTQLYRMPQPAAYYATNGADSQLQLDASMAAQADYAVSNYDRVIVFFTSLGGIPHSQITFGGQAQISAAKIWINGEFDFRVVAHELGHTYGLFHAGLWQVSDGNPISTNGVAVEYGDDFDTMGANYANDTRTDFNPYYKNRINWIHSAQVLTVTSNGVYRVNRFDNATGTGTLGLKIVRDGSRSYWIGCRRAFTGNASMQNGAYVIWGYNNPLPGSGGGYQSALLDLTTPGNSDQDAALAIGALFSDPVGRITIQPVSQGGVSPDEYIDVQITFIPAPPRLYPGDVVIADTSAIDGQGALIKLDPQTGAQATFASGGYLGGPSDIAFAANGDVFVVNRSTNSIVRLDRLTGTQTLISTNGNLLDPTGIAMDSTGNLLVATRGNISGQFGGVVKIDPATGAQTMISSNGFFVHPTTIRIVANGNILVVDSDSFGGSGGVIQVDPANGTQTIVSANGNFLNPLGIAITANGDLLVTDADAFGGTGGVLKVNPDTGAQTVVSSGNYFTDPARMVVDGNGDYLVCDLARRVIHVNHSTGIQTVVSTNGIFVEPFGIAIVPSPTVPVFQTITRSNNTINLTWTAIPGRMYQLQSSTDLKQTNWIILRSAVTASNGIMSVSDTIAGTGPGGQGGNEQVAQKFYRAVLLP